MMIDDFGDPIILIPLLESKSVLVKELLLPSSLIFFPSE